MNRSDSVLSFYKELIALRKAPEYVETFTYGTFAAAYEDVDHMFAYYRTNEETGQRILVAEISAQTPRHCRLKTGCRVTSDQRKNCG